MEILLRSNVPSTTKTNFLNTNKPSKTHSTTFSFIPLHSSPCPQLLNSTIHDHPNPLGNTTYHPDKNQDSTYPTMSDILCASKLQNLDLQLKTLGPFFRITARSLETQRELGRAEGWIRVWIKNGRILHLDSIRLKRETLGMEKSIFGIGLFLGAVAVRYGYDSGCKTAELLAINDTDLYHSKLVRFYTRIGFKAVHEVTGSTIGDLTHMLVWGGVGTRMDADIEQLLDKWCSRFKSSKGNDLQVSVDGQPSSSAVVKLKDQRVRDCCISN